MLYAISEAKYLGASSQGSDLDAMYERMYFPAILVAIVGLQPKLEKYLETMKKIS
jgi:hypothetical protein